MPGIDADMAASLRKAVNARNDRLKKREKKKERNRADVEQKALGGVIEGKAKIIDRGTTNAIKGGEPISGGFSQSDCTN